MIFTTDGCRLTKVDIIERIWHSRLEGNIGGREGTKQPEKLPDNWEWRILSSKSLLTKISWMLLWFNTLTGAAATHLSMCCCSVPLFGSALMLNLRFQIQSWKQKVAKNQILQKIRLKSMEKIIMFHDFGISLQGKNNILCDPQGISVLTNKRRALVINTNKVELFKPPFGY